MKLFLIILLLIGSNILIYIKTYSKKQPHFFINILFWALFCGGVVGNIYAGMMIQDEWSKYHEKKTINQVRPKIILQCACINKEKFTFFIKTPKNLKKIKDLSINFRVNGKVVKIYSRPKIGLGIPLTYNSRPFFYVNGEPIIDQITIQGKEILPSRIEGVIVEVKKTEKTHEFFDDKVYIEWYWDFNSRMQREYAFVEKDKFIANEIVL